MVTSTPMASGSPLRKTRRRFENPAEARFLTFSCYRRLRLFDNDRIKDAFLDELARAREATGFLLLGYVVMPEHVHAVVAPKLPDAPIPRVLRVLKGPFAHRVLTRWEELHAPVLANLIDASGQRRFWQPGGGYDRNVRVDGELVEKLDYMHANPVKRGLVGRPTDWRWSSAPWYAGLRDAALRIDEVPLW